jgi:anaerobic selenocysteine-containing dehydrogenase
MALHSLNALAGNLGVRGGLLIQGDLPLTAVPRVSRDEVARRGLDHPRLDGAGQGEYLLASDAPQALPERILAGMPYPINVLFLFATNPVANHPAKERFAEAMRRIPFSVASPFLDESSAMADLILPDHTYLERGRRPGRTPGGLRHLASAWPRPPRHPFTRRATRPTSCSRLAKALGGASGSLPRSSRTCSTRVRGPTTPDELRWSLPTPRSHSGRSWNARGN